MSGFPHQNFTTKVHVYQFTHRQQVLRLMLKQFMVCLNHFQLPVHFTLLLEATPFFIRQPAEATLFLCHSFFKLQSRVLTKSTNEYALLSYARFHAVTSETDVDRQTFANSYQGNNPFQGTDVQFIQDLQMSRRIVGTNFPNRSPRNPKLKPCTEQH